MKSNEEIKKLAVDIAEGKVFTSAQIENVEDYPMIFLPLILGALKDKSKEDLQKIGLMYEYIDKAMPRSINGYPIFSSFNLLSQEEFKILNAYYVDYIKLKDEFLKDPKGGTDSDRGTDSDSSAT